MNLKEIEISDDATFFHVKGKMLFDRKFKKVLKFHEPGLAPVSDESGWYHIDLDGKETYHDRYDRAFGYYFGFASVVKNNSCFHIDTYGKRIYEAEYTWTGNFQEGVCVVRDKNHQYFHIDGHGGPTYSERYSYAGDYYEYICCVKDSFGWKHIRKDGTDLNGIYYLDLKVFHKGIACAKDQRGWFHIDKTGKEFYSQRFLDIEPFYNGWALVTGFDEGKRVINEVGGTF